jgi:alpha-beta hydrolase superfamily lysophospholipase
MFARVVRALRTMLRLVVNAVMIAAAVVATIILIRAFDARKLPDLQVWHREMPASEFRAEDAASIPDLEAWREREATVMAEVRRLVQRDEAVASASAISRYEPRSPLNPENLGHDWNRTFEVVPERIRGGALLLHGLTDSPYSMRAVAEVLAAQGIYALALRLPGHGTVPGALTAAGWTDWMAATRLGARWVRERIGPAGPLYVVGYSNGGALAATYALDALEDPSLPSPKRLILLSPAIGVTAFGAFASWNRILSRFEYFEKFAWQDVLPEFDPFKYNSFPKHAGDQIYRLTQALEARLAGHASDGVLSAYPPVLTFQSLVDSTVLTDAIIDRLYERLPASGSELVLFDINRLAAIEPLLLPDYADPLVELREAPSLPFAVTIVSNESGGSLGVVARTRPALGTLGQPERLGLEWADGVYSLSHVAIPFRPDDPLYGEGSSAAIALGALSPRGERDMLRVPLSQFMRLRYNPFIDYVERRMVEAVQSDLGGEQGHPPQSQPLTQPD